MIQRIYREGETFHYRGKPLLLKTEEVEATKNRVAALERVKLSKDEQHLLYRPGSGFDARQCILFWYTAQTERIVNSLLPNWAKKLQVRPNSAAVKFAKTRWGSCSSSGRLFFNNRMAMLSDDLAEYIVVHELCHLKQMNHSKAFWDEVERALPGCMGMRRRLREEEKFAVL